MGINEYFSVRQLASMLGIAEGTVRKMAEKGRIPYYKPFEGNKLYFKKSEIDSLFTNSRIPSVAELVQNH